MIEPVSSDVQTDFLKNYKDSGCFEVSACDHDMTFFPAGRDRLTGLVKHIDEAKHSLHAFFYMFQHDDSGHEIRDALIRAAERGVDVHLIIDAFGSDAPDAFFEPLIEAGGKFGVFSPRWGSRYLIRNHQKFAIADRERVITGGFNVSDHYFAPPPENGWCDLGVLIEGGVVHRFSEWFAHLADWTSGRRIRFRTVRRVVRDWDGGTGGAQLLLGGPTHITNAWARRVRKDIAHGQRLDLVMAYFSPPRSFRKLIAKLSRRGDARLIMAGKSDNIASIAASRALYKKLLRADAQIHEFEPCKLHMKLLVIDDVSYFGSANMDMRSIRLNLELMVRIEDAALASRLRGLIDHMEESSTQITESWYRSNASWLNRLRWRIGLFLVSVIDYTVTRSLTRRA